MKKIVKAVPPFNETNSCNFKMKPYLAWNGMVASAHYPPRLFRRLAHLISLPSFFKNTKEARLRFLEAGSMNFGAFPDYAIYETIPLIWDCWPHNDENVVNWFTRHNVRTAIFTSSEAANRICKRISELRVMTITEGIDTEKYPEGKLLKDRGVELLSYGRTIQSLIEECNEKAIKVLKSPPMGSLESALENSKITIAIPRCDVDRVFTGGQETLTQRYWEGMLSRIVMVGRCPKELKDLIGYDPVIPIDFSDFSGQIKNILSNIEEYQELVDRNRDTALKHASWEIRMNKVMDWLGSLGYQVR